jgi:rfaE bifunctional protein nucleotidyltransferase chain/domain
VLHIGHIRYLKDAKKLGDVLIIGLNTDSSVKQYKGDKRPLMPEDERAEMLSALEFVDYIVKFSERDPRNLLDAIKPDIHVKGGDYKMEQIIEKDVVEKNGGKVVLLPLVHGKSTTNIINRIIEVYGNK